ncbi:hypothetical protein LVJ84_03445 [Kingella potus]|nr:hypothetical protein [Kingella potus]UOP01315.1 hypothetical protein LVJ84_03445 [Kingella potus]
MSALRPRRRAAGWKRRIITGTGDTLPPNTGSVITVWPPMRIISVEWPNQTKRLLPSGAARKAAQSGRTAGSGLGGRRDSSPTSICHMAETRSVGAACGSALEKVPLSGL